MPGQAARWPCGNLPVDVTSFVGRREELSGARRSMGVMRLLTFTGVGGVGKTRLALRLADEVRRAFPDGTWLVELAPLRDEALLTPTVASTLGVSDRTSRPPANSLLSFVGEKRLLIILDNCEHLLDACAALASRLLASSPGVRLLATSRQPLGIQGECVVNVSPLSVPEPTEAISAAEFDEYGATRLFAERARAAAPGFAITNGNRRTVARLCRRLDGLPLAIELAVVRLRSLSAEQVLDRLDDRFRLLTGGCRAASPRQRTMRAAIDWSHELCSPEARTLWARLSVFSGTFDLRAVEVVCGDEAIAPENTVDLVAELVDKSILVRETRDGYVRYRLLETIQRFGLDRLIESGEADALRRRHRDYYREMMDGAAQAWFGPDQLGWYAHLRLDHANIRAALAYCLGTPGQSQAALRIVSAAWDYWIFCGLLGEARRWLCRALRQDRTPTTSRAKALWVAGRLALLQGDMVPALSLIHECRDLAHDLGDASSAAYATEHLGMVAMFQGDYERGAALLEEALAGHRTIGDPPGACWMAEYRLALAVSALGDAERATALGGEVLAMAESHDAVAYRPLALWVLGFERYRSGDLCQANTLLAESLRLQRIVDDRWNIALCMEVLAWAAAADGRHEHASQVSGAVSTLWRSLGSPMPALAPFADFHDACESRVRQALGDAAYAAAFRRGADLTLDDAIGYTLREKASTPSRSRATDTRPVLTRRERQVAGLVAQGMTNKDIAAALVIAQRTAEGHVENILTKLGFTSRTQVATWVAKQDG